MEPLEASDPVAIGGHRLLARLGAGGMGQVYLGRAADGRHVAIKVIRADFEGPEALARFRREVETVGAVRSAFSASLVAAGLDRPPYWLATEYVQGPTLAEAVRDGGPLPPGTCLRLLAELARALDDLHGRRVQHRDLKPQNIILAPDGPRLIDFGIAKVDDQTAITRTGVAPGTPGYLAPEVITEQRVSPAADMFALAGVMFFAATGERPFGGGDPHAVLYRSVHHELSLDGIEPALAACIHRCAAKDPADRPTPEQLLSLRGANQEPVGTDPVYRARTKSPSLEAALAAVAGGGLAGPEATGVTDRAEVGGGAGGRAGGGAGAGSTGATAVQPPYGPLGGNPAGQVPPGRDPATTVARRGRVRSPRLVAGGAAFGLLAAITAGVVLINLLPGDPTSKRGAEAGTTPGVSSTSGTAGNGAGASAPSPGTRGSGNPGTGQSGAGTGDATTPGGTTATGKPIAVLRNRTGLRTNELVWSSQTDQCEPSIPYEETPPDDLQWSAFRPIPKSDGSVTLQLRRKYAAPAGFYVAAEVSPPAQWQGNTGARFTSKPLLMRGYKWTAVRYPQDFGAGAFFQTGDWTVIWYHVYGNGQAYSILCQGFEVT